MCAWHVYIEEYLKLGKVLGKAGHANACLNTDIQFFLGLHTHFPIFIIYAGVIKVISFTVINKCNFSDLSLSEREAVLAGSAAGNMG